jgi:hypothetical protein
MNRSAKPVIKKAGIKAGSIGLATLLLSMLVNQLVPLSDTLIYALCGLNMLLYIGIGVLAGLFVATPRTLSAVGAARSAAAGAVAGAIAGAISGVATGGLALALLLIRQRTGWLLPQVEPWRLQQIAAIGLRSQLWAVAGAFCVAASNLLVTTMGGAITAAVRAEAV